MTSKIIVSLKGDFSKLFANVVFFVMYDHDVSALLATCLASDRTEVSLNTCTQKENTSILSL